MVEISVNASRLLYPIPVEALKEGKLGHFDWYDATTGESEIVKGVMDYVYNTFGSKALPKTITFGKTPTRMTRLIQDYDLAHKSSMMQTDEVGLVNIESDCVTVDVKSLIDPLDFDSSGDFADTFALDLSKHFLTTADWILLEPLIARNRCLQVRARGQSFQFFSLPAQCLTFLLPHPLSTPPSTLSTASHPGSPACPSTPYSSPTPAACCFCCN